MFPKKGAANGINSIEEGFKNINDCC